VPNLSALLKALAALVQAFVAAGGVDLVVLGLREYIAGSKARSKLAEQAWLDAELASGDVSRMERAAAKLLDSTDHHRQAGDSGLRPGGGDGNDQPEPVPPDAPSIAAMRAELDGLGLLD
jgi:hypothetical protein